MKIENRYAARDNFIKEEQTRNLIAQIDSLLAQARERRLTPKRLLLIHKLTMERNKLAECL